MVFNDKIREACEALDWVCRVYGEYNESQKNRYVELENWPPAGEDLVITLGFDTFVEDLNAYAEAFDPDEHITMWVMAKAGGGEGVPSVRRLAVDAEDIEDMLDQLAMNVAIAAQEA